ncbi:Eco57I restriction-modification methylase domain-containing protein [Chryseobacterium sp. Leaf180]|uniref:Eco57I restriction-modification methylase domain-containing protein n=1 Tax=Chryseobacterium sp. Leaf180 TaxID=1736289 RepID=UPI000AAEFBE8|nr:N-6 DNA methylase [Chryseobacterium sp. Leaf180]
MFQKTIVNKYLKSQNTDLISSKWNLFTAHFHHPEIQENIRQSKEEQYQGEFLIDLFVNIFGYTKNPTPAYNLTTEYKNVKDSKKADGAIVITGSVKAIIELKGTKTTDLSKIEEQAFGYKNNQPDCKYIITSNFEKLRFYIDNAIEHLEFNLFELKFEEFQLLYLCLAFENIAAGIPGKIKDESLSQEDVITKKLYKDYSLFKRELFQNLLVLNPEIDQLELFKKSQKLLDRFLFLFFGEDSGLLPPNSVRMILEQWDKLRDLDEYVPLYDRFRKYFTYLNTGFKGKQFDVFAYNGGLFKPDEILDTIQIDDQLLYTHTMRLAEYDFQSEVDVNILGHIFENSLNEIDEIKAQLAGEVIDKSKTKRKKDGVFYTPKYITKYIVENTVGKLCEEKKAEFTIVEEEYFTDRKRQQKTKAALLQKLYDYRDWLHQITIIDPACGSGAFLNEALNFLITEHQYIDELEAKLTGSSIAFTYHSESILENNLFGVDLNEESVEIAKLSLWLRTAEKNRKLNSLNSNIKCGNSLIDDPEIAGDKAFNWEQEFPQVFSKGGFDVVIGNPPYGVNFNENEKKFLSNFDDFVPDFEIYIYFISLYKKVLRTNGVLSYIFPNTFLATVFGKKYREMIFKNVQVYEIVDLSQDNTFADAAVRTCIFSFTNSSKDYKTYLKKIQNKQFIELVCYEKSDILKEVENVLSLFSQNKIEKLIISKLSENQILANFLEVSQGLIPYDKYRGHDEETIKNRIWHANYKKDDTFQKELKGGDVWRYGIHWNEELWISYGDWLAAPRKKEYFTNARLLIREILSGNLFCTWTEEEFYNTPSIINIINKKDLLDLKFALPLINSKLIGWFTYKTSPKANKGLFPKILVGDVKKIPIKEIPSESQKPFIIKADQMLSLNKELQEVNAKFLRIFKEEYKINKLSKKLEGWYKLSFSEFLAELKKQKVELSLSQKADLEEYFDREKTKAVDLQSTIAGTDKEIDQMVYALYGLTEEEIAVVENS